METINPKNFIDIDPLLVSFITLKDGNMIMIDETVPAKPNKVRLFQEEEKNNNEPISKKKNKSQKLSLSEQFNLNFIGSQKKMEPITIIKKSDFNSISKISKNISFSFLYNKDGIKNINLPSPNCSVDIKSSMFQTRRENNNLNFNNMNMNTINNNILSEDNVNIHMIDTTMSKQLNYNNNNNEKKEQIVPANIFKSNLIENNYKLKSKNNENEDNQKYNFEDNKNNYDYNDNSNNNNNFIKKDNLNDKMAKDEQNENNLNNKKEKTSFINRPSLVMQNNNLYSQNQNNYRSNNLSSNEPIKNNLTEINMNDMSRDKKRASINRYSKINNRLSKSGKDNNYVKAVVSLNIPAEDQEEINLVKQFNSLVDRLNGQKSHQHTKINLKKSDKYYELYKNSNEINLLNSILSPGRNRKKIGHNNYIIDTNNNNNNYSNSKFIDNNLSNYLSNDVSMISYGRNNNNNLNSRIMALRERTYTSINNSFRNDSRDNFSSSINSEIVLPSNFAFRK